MRVDRIASVASFFVSRVDTAVDRLLDERIGAAAGERRAAARARCAARPPSRKPSSPTSCSANASAPTRFALLAREGARPQRPLWASTSTKNPAYPDVYYVEALIGPDTVNTMPPATLRGIPATTGIPSDRLGQAIDRARERPRPAGPVRHRPRRRHRAPRDRGRGGLRRAPGESLLDTVGPASRGRCGSPARTPEPSRARGARAWCARSAS